MYWNILLRNGYFQSILLWDSSGTMDTFKMSAELATRSLFTFRWSVLGKTYLLLLFGLGPGDVLTCNWVVWDPAGLVSQPDNINTCLGSHTPRTHTVALLCNHRRCVDLIATCRYLCGSLGGRDLSLPGAAHSTWHLNELAASASLSDGGGSFFSFYLRDRYNGTSYITFFSVWKKTSFIMSP